MSITPQPYSPLHRVLTALFFLLCTLTAGAQSRHVMLLPDYEDGIVYLKNGMWVRVPLNYDAGMSTMRYKENDLVMELQNVADVDSVHIGKHLFIPLQGRFCEVFRPTGAAAEANAVLIDWRLSYVHVGYKGAMGQVSQVKGHSVNLSAMGSELFGNMDSTQGATDAKLENNTQDVHRRQSTSNFYIARNGKTQKFHTKKQLLKLFPGREDAVERALHHHRADFQQPETIAQALLDLIK